jgi:hypothetical protein
VIGIAQRSHSVVDSQRVDRYVTADHPENHGLQRPSLRCLPCELCRSVGGRDTERPRD